MVSVQFHEFGVRLNFVPVITPRGTIQLKVAPEVSALDYTNGLTVQGFIVPGVSTRRVSTEVELGDGQSFAIAGLLDKRVVDSFEKMPLIGSVPVLGKLFQSKSTTRTNTELVVIVTPELVRPMPAGAPAMSLSYPKPFMESSPESAVRTPGVDKTGPVAPPPADKTIPVEKLLKSMADEKAREENGRKNAPQQDIMSQIQTPATPTTSQSSPKK